MKLKKTTAVLLAGAVTASLMLGGCGTGVNSDNVALTCGDEEFTLGYLNFVARYNQVLYDSMFYYYYGEEDYWSDPAYGDGYGGTMEDEVKDSVLEEVEVGSVLDQHRDDYGVEITDEEIASMQTAAEEFLSENTRQSIRYMGASEEYVSDFLYYETVIEKMEEAIEAEAGEDLDIADYARRTFSYIRVDAVGYTDDDDEYVEYTEEERENLKEQTELIAEEAADDFDTAADDYGYYVYTHSYGEDEASEEDGGFSEAVIAEADSMSEGDVSGVIDTDDYFYIIRLDSEDDQDAAESAMSSASSQMKSDHYEEVVEGYLDECEFTLDEKLWDKVKFSNLFTIVYDEDEEE